MKTNKRKEYKPQATVEVYKTNILKVLFSNCQIHTDLVLECDRFWAAFPVKSILQTFQKGQKHWKAKNNQFLSGRKST